MLRYIPPHRLLTLADITTGQEQGQGEEQALGVSAPAQVLRVCRGGSEGALCTLPHLSCAGRDQDQLLISVGGAMLVLPLPPWRMLWSKDEAATAKARGDEGGKSHAVKDTGLALGVSREATSPLSSAASPVIGAQASWEGCALPEGEVEVTRLFEAEALLKLKPKQSSV